MIPFLTISSRRNRSLLVTPTATSASIFVNSLSSNSHHVTPFTIPSSFSPHPHKAAFCFSRSAFMADDPIPESSLSFKEKLRSSFCFFCCFHHHHHASVKPKLVRSSSLQNKPSRTYDLPHLKEKCNKFISRIGRHHRRHSADFHYDALSYALNFEDEAIDDKRPAGDFRNFSARLLPSPPPRMSSDPTTTGKSPLLVDL